MNNVLACSLCDVVLRRAHRIEAGQRYCQACYARVFQRTQCEICGEKARARRDDPTPQCSRCRSLAFWRGQRCVRCDRELETRTSARCVLPDGRLCCAACRHHFRPPKTCAYCGAVGLCFARDFAHGFNEPACGKCRRHAALSNCAGCRRNRRMAGERDGRSYCADCLPTGKPPLIHCEACGQTKPAYSKRFCEDCGWERNHQKLLQSLYPRLKTDWARTLLDRYHRESVARVPRTAWLRSLRRDVDAFAALEGAFSTEHELSGVLIIRRLGTGFTTKYQRVMSFLAHARLVLLDDDPDYELEFYLDRLRQLIPKDQGWITDVLQRFLGRMLHVRDKVHDRRRHGRVPITPKAIESAMRAAHALLIFSRDEQQVADIRGVSQDVLNLFLAKRIRMRLQVRAFLRYVNKNERTFHTLKAHSVPFVFPAHLVLPDTTCRAIIQWARDVTRPSELRAALAMLFSLIYAQFPTRTLALRLDALTETETGFRITLGKVPLDLDPLVCSLLRRWLALRREASVFDVTLSNPYLFPGKVATTHVQTTMLQTCMEKFKVGARQLRTTGLVALVRSGIEQPRVLEDCFGISAGIAIKYCAALGAFDRAKAKFVINRNEHP